MTWGYNSLHWGFLRRLALSCLVLPGMLQMAACSRAIIPTKDQTEITPTTPPAAITTITDVPSSLAALASHSQQIRFEHLPPDKGLSQSVVTDFVQDDQGFLWLATQEGLNRYDGFTFKVFKEDPDLPGGIKGNFVASIDKGPGGEIWIGTADGGLNRYDSQTGQFSTYVHDPMQSNSLSESSISSLDVDPQGIVWVGTNNKGLNRLDPHSGQITRYLNDPQNPNSLNSNTIINVLADNSGIVWVGTLDGGLNRLDPQTGRFTHFLNDPLDLQSISSNDIQTLYIDRQGVLWVGTFTGGLNRYDPQNSSFTRYVTIADDPASLSSNSVAAIHEDSTGRFWVGTQGGGLNLLDRSSGVFTRIQNDPDNPTSLSTNSVMSIYEDNSGIIWFGTFGSGTDYFDPYKNKFVWIHAEPGNPNSLSSNSLWTIYEDDQGVLWIATNGNGLNRFDPQKGEWKHYLNDPTNPDSLSNNTVYLIYPDHQGTFWLGTPDSLNRFDPRSETFYTYTTPGLLAILEDSQGNFWLGSTQGLILFDRQTGNTRYFLSDPNDPTTLNSNVVSALFEDADQNFWVGTFNGGFHKYDRQANIFIRYTKDPQDQESISSNTILTIYQAEDGGLWLGTSGGLNRFDPQTEKFTAWREQDGLPNDYIYGILEDDQGHLWLSTNKGISHFDPGESVFKNYDKTDGLQSNEFNQWSAFRNREGVMYFGGVNGLNAFHPDQIHENPYIPPIVLTGFEIYNRPVEIAPDSALQQPIETSQEINLSHTDDFFQFEYAALHFSSPEEIVYAYQMEGLDKGWNMVGKQHSANYTNVPPGDYIFRVKGTNSDGVWNEDGVALKITIPPPFWQTTWFRVLAILTVIGGISGVFLLRIRSIENQRQQLESQVDERTHELRQTMLALESARDAAQAANRAKSTFLANMSHELRTPLNAILGFTQVMARDKRLPAEHLENVAIVQRSSEHLLGLINDVLEVSKIEAGRASLNPRNFDLHHMMEGLQEMFALRAEKKDIVLQMTLASDIPRYVNGDEGKLRQVLMNLLGNAVKFTNQGQVVLRVQTPSASQDRHVNVLFVVEDSGPGIAPQEMELLFIPFVQTSSGHEAQEGSGLGLSISQQYVQLMGGEIRVSSQLGTGSRFEFDIPLQTVSIADFDKPPLTRRVVGLEPGQPTYRLLVVDDQEVNRKLLVKIFQPLGFEIRQAANGKEALNVWQAWNPHLIWMDMRMPVMDGYEATRQIKATTQGMATIIIALTASALEEDKQVILSEGCDDYMRKPFVESDLLEATARHLGVRYIYEDILPADSATGKAGQTQASKGDYQELIPHLQAADPVWISNLEQATILGDLDQINRLARQIEEQDPELASRIASLADRFEHDQILALIEQSRNPNENAAY